MQLATLLVLVVIALLVWYWTSSTREDFAASPDITVLFGNNAPACPVKQGNVGRFIQISELPYPISIVANTAVMSNVITSFDEMSPQRGSNDQSNIVTSNTDTTFVFSNTTLDVFEMCGGTGGHGAVQTIDGPFSHSVCPTNTMCTRLNEQFWQCLPAPYSVEQHVLVGQTVNTFEACGGKGTACPPDVDCNDAPWQGYSVPQGFECKRVNEWFWQALPQQTGDQPGWTY